MSATLATIVRPNVTKSPGVFAQLVSARWQGIARYFARRAAIARLHELDDRALRDIGLARSQIEAVVDGLHHSFRPSGDAMMASSAVMGPRADGRRRASAAEAATWS